MKARRNSLAEQLNHLLDLAKTEDISVRTVMENLTGRGHAVLLIIFSLPFCQPIQIPGFSTPFGILLGFIGLRIAFGHRAWLPRRLLDMKISQSVLQKISSIAIKITDWLRFLTSTRWVWLAQNPSLHIAHGLTITALSLLLALPLPIPLTNLFAAYPILAFGLGLLEEDGVMITIAYILSFACLGFVLGIVFFGHLIGQQLAYF